MTDFVPVNGNPFEQSGPQLVPVSHNPFETVSQDHGQMGDDGKRHYDAADVPGAAVANAGTSVKKLLSGFADAIAHPVDTVKGVGQLALGAAQRTPVVSIPMQLLGETVNKLAGSDPGLAKTFADGFNAYRKGNDKALDDFLGMMADRYGSWDNAKRTIAEDPAGFVSDASALFTGGTGGAARAGLRTTSRVAGVADRLGQEVTSIVSGISPEAQQLAQRAGELGGNEGRAFRSNMARPDREGLVDRAQTAADRWAADNSRNYLSDKANWADANRYLDAGPVKQALNDARSTFSFNGVADNASIANALDAAEGIVNRRLNRPVPANIPASTPANSGLRASGATPATITAPAGTVRVSGAPGASPGPVQAVSANIGAQSPSLSATFNNMWNAQHAAPPSPRVSGPAGNGVMGPHPSPHYTPEGFDRLKQELDTLMYDRNVAPEGTKARVAVGRVAGAVRDQLRREVPGYAAAMERSGNAIQQINGARSALSLGEKASVDTAMSKLLSTMRNDVSSRYGARTDALNHLAQYDPTLPYAIAGQTMNSIAPRGLVGRGIAALKTKEALGAGGVGAVISPAAMSAAALTLLKALPGLATQSPRVIGNARYGVGAATRYARNAGITERNIARVLEARRAQEQENE